MNNALEYLSWRGDLSFLQSPVNEVDLFLCSQLSTPDYIGIVSPVHKPVLLPEVSERYFKHHTLDVAILGALQSDSVLPMLKELPKHPRFAEVSLFSYVQKVDRDAGEQFSAVSVGFPDGSICIAYQGTDDTIIGWKEDFNIAVMDTVPAQQDAVTYLERVARNVEGPIYIVGHSKGGNLAVYAAANASPKVRERIVRVISFDGPGFREGFLLSDGYRAVSDRVETVLSQNSMVGVLLGLAGRQVIVRSHNKGLLAHDGFSWEVRGASFVRCASLSKDSRNFDKTIDAVLESITPEECADFIDGLFDALFATGSVTVTDLKRLRFNQVLLVIYRFAAKKRLTRTISVLVDAIFHTRHSSFKSEIEWMKSSSVPKAETAEAIPEKTAETSEKEADMPNAGNASAVPEEQTLSDSAEKAGKPSGRKTSAASKRKSTPAKKIAPAKKAAKRSAPKAEPTEESKSPETPQKSAATLFDLFAQQKPRTRRNAKNRSRQDKKK